MDPHDPAWEKIERRERFPVGIGIGVEHPVGIFMVQFHQQGIFVHFPYHPNSTGLVSRAVAPRGPGKSKVDLGKFGRVTSHKAKYSHPVDGRCHFSQDGRVVNDPDVRSQGRRLLDETGQLFSVDVQGLASFKRFDLNRYYRTTHGRAFFEFPQADPDSAFHLSARWVNPQNDGLAVDDVTNPVDGVLPDGTTIPALAIAPPTACSYRDRLLLLEARTRPHVADGGSFALVFTGGWSPAGGDTSQDAEFLWLVYPAEDTEDLPSIDWLPDRTVGRPKTSGPSPKSNRSHMPE